MQFDRGATLPGWNAYKDTVTTAEIDPTFKDVQLQNMHSFFRGFTKLRELIHFDYIDTSRVGEMSDIFYDCDSITSLDLSSWDTSCAYSVYQTFGYMSNLTKLNISGWNLNNTEYFGYTFGYCPKLADLNMTGVTAKKPRGMEYMFDSDNALP